jgi:D-3-phosphoglycerate dehydrogenase
MQNKHKVLVLGPLPDKALALFAARDDIDHEVIMDVSEENVLALIPGVSGITVRAAKITPEIIARADALKVVSRNGVGYDSVDIPALDAHGIPLTVVGTANSVNVAELAFHMMLSIAKRGMRHDREIRGGNWDYKYQSDMIELWEKTLLIVGFGRIGTRVAKRAHAFEMKVLVCDPYIDQKLITDAGCTPVDDFRAVLPEVDYLTLHLPKSPEMVGMIGAAELKQMKRSAVVVNCARGGLVDEAALHAALSEDALFGAGLDVFAEEPPAPDNPLFGLDNFICSPHMGGASQEASLRGGIVCVQNVIDAIDGKLDPDFVINKNVLQR